MEKRIWKKKNIEKIEKQFDDFDKIIKVNQKYDETGVFCMPKEYFEGWIRDITICIKKIIQKFMII